MTKRKVITEEDLLNIERGGTLQIAANCIVTPSALDRANERKIKFVAFESSRERLIAIGADHAGFETKEGLKNFIRSLGYECRDFGTHDTTPVDYPDFAFAVASAVSRGECSYGIMVDGAGIGSCIAANKVPGVRAALCYDQASAKNSREHNFSNVLTLGARLVDQQGIHQIVKTWLETGYGEERHARRVQKITLYENKLLSSGEKMREMKK